MKFGFTAITALVVAALLAPSLASADDNAPSTTPLTNKLDRVSYAIGLYVANSIIKRNDVEVNVDVMAQAISDVIQDKTPKLNQQQAQEVLAEYEKELHAKREAKRIKLAEKNRGAGEEFLLANKQKAGIRTTMVRTPDNTMAELQYKVIAEGKGDSPKVSDIAVINVKGTRIDGKEVENATNRRVPVARTVPPGLSEAVQLMKPGAKWQVFLPSPLTFGDYGSGPNIEPGSALIYELELVSVETPAPLTSDIVMVPSLEQMRAGSNVVVIKPGDVPKYTQTNAAPVPQKK